MHHTCEHLLTIRILIEKVVEYDIIIFLAFINFQKAFDPVEHWAIKKSLIDAKIDHRYTTAIQNIYQNATSAI